MRSIIAVLLALAMCVTMAACAQKEDTSSSGTTVPTTASDLEGKTLTEAVDLIYAKHPIALSVMTVPVDLSDEYAVKSYLGLDSADGVTEAVASESAFGSQAYSLVLCRISDPAKTQSIARAMYDGIDQRKWICVNADDLMVTAYQDLVLLVMISSEYEDSATAEELTEAFIQVCGSRPQLTLED